MKCNCPKCHADIELDLPNVTEKGSPAACPECKARLFVHREDFGSRANRMTGAISCAHCGDPLGPDTYCYECGVPFPDYLVVTQGRKPSAPHRSEIKTASFALPTGWGKRAKGPSAPKQTYHESKTRGGLGKKQLTSVLVVLLVLALGGAGFVAYSRSKAQKAYADTFVKLTYCVHSGQERALRTCVKLAADWKSLNGGQGAPPSVGEAVANDFATLKAEIGALQAKLPPPPEKYRQATELLDQLNASSQKMLSLALAPSPSLVSLGNATTKYNAEYQNVARQFKAGVPEELMGELQSASKRYKGLQTLL